MAPKKIANNVWPEKRESALNSCRAVPTKAHHEQGTKFLPGIQNDKFLWLLKRLALLFLLVCLLWSDLLRLILEVLSGAVCLLVLSFVVVWVFNCLSYGLVSDAFSSLDGVSHPPRPRFFGVAGFFEDTGRTVSCVVSRFLAVVGVAGHVCMGAGRAVSCVISRLLVVAVIARHPRALAWSSVSSVVTWLSGLEQVNQGRAPVSSSGTNMPGTFPAPLVIVVPDSLIRSLASPISVPNAASQVVATQVASACPSTPTFIKSRRTGRDLYPQSRDRSVVSLGNSTEQDFAGHSMPVSQELRTVMTTQMTCVEAPGCPEPKALLLCEEGQPAVKTQRYAGNAAFSSPRKITVGKKSSALRGAQQSRRSAPLASRLTRSWMAAPLVTEALSVACNLGSMFGLKVHLGEQVNDSDRSPEDAMDFEPTSTVVAPVDIEALMQDAPCPIGDDGTTDEMDWKPTYPRLSLEEEGFLVRIFSALSLVSTNLVSPKPKCIADRVQKPASSGVIAEPLTMAVSTVSQAPVEVNQGPHAPSATPKTVTVRKITLSMGGKKVPRKGVAESAFAKTLLPTPSTSVPPQAEVQTAALTSGNGEGGSTSGNPPLLPAPGPSANTASQLEQPSCESTGENGSTPALTEPAAAANSPAPQAGLATPGRELKRTEVNWLAKGQGIVEPTTTAEKLAFLRELAAKTISEIDAGLLGPNDREKLMVFYTVLYFKMKKADHL